MEDICQVLFELVKPLVDDPDSVSVKQLPSMDSKEIVLCVYAKSEDVARLIGKRGNMANAIRSMMNIASRVKNVRIQIKFESYEMDA